MFSLTKQIPLEMAVFNWTQGSLRNFGRSLARFVKTEISTVTRQEDFAELLDLVLRKSTGFGVPFLPQHRVMLLFLFRGRITLPETNVPIAN